VIQVKRVYEKPAKADGYRVLVDRLWPRGMKKEDVKMELWMKEVAPSDAVRKAFGHEVQLWPRFEKRYKAELAGRKELLRELKKLEKEHGTVTLLYGAKDQEHNQAVVLADVLRGPV
jgi:uncharacterized protein YeaO (DUF488 family)